MPGTVFFKILFAIALVLSVIAPSYAASGPADVTLEELLNEARANNQELQAAREARKAKELSVRAEGALDDPTLKVEMMDLQRDHPLANGPGNAMQTRYTVSQMFPFYGKRSLKEKIALKESLAAGAELRQRELEVEESVKEAFYDCFRLDRTIGIINEVKELLAYMSTVTETMYATGQATQQDFIKVQAEGTMLENELIMLGAEKDATAARLNSLLNRPLDSSYGAFKAALDAKFEIDEADLIKRAVDSSPSIAGVKRELEANELTAELSRKNYYPDIMVGVAPIQRDGRFDTYDLMFQVNIPLWRDKYDSQSAQATANAAGARFKLMAERNVKGLEVKEAALMAKAAGRVKVLYETSLLPQMETSFESAIKNFQAGKIDMRALLDTERELKRTRIGRLNAEIDYMKKLARLERAIGEDIFTVRNGMKP